MKFTNSPFAILDKNMSSFDYQKRYVAHEDHRRREVASNELHKEFEKDL